MPLTELLQRFKVEPENNHIMVELGRRTSDPSAKAALEAAFRSANDRQRKFAIAMAIGSVTKLDQWMYEQIEAFATDAIRSGSPTMFLYDADGKDVRGQLAPEWVKWCETQGLNQSDCHLREMSVFGQAIICIGSLRDRRAMPLLREGLNIKDQFIMYLCITALARMPDASVVDDIVRMSSNSRLPDSTRKMIKGLLKSVDAPGASERLRLLLDPESFKKYEQERAAYVKARAATK